MEPQEWNVLLVEDEYDSQQMISQILEFNGIAMTVAEHGEESLAMAANLQPTLVIMDLAMPIMNGWETLKALRENASTAHLPVVAITAYHSVEVADEALKAGFDAYFAKPIDPMKFIARLREIVDSVN